MRASTYCFVTHVIVLAFLSIQQVAYAGIISEKQEISYGNSMHAALIAQCGGTYNNPQKQVLVNEMGKKIAAISDRPHLPWMFTLVNDPSVNAFATLGGKVYVTKGMLEFVESNDELALVIAHEIGHVAKKHIVKKLEQEMATSLLVLALTKDISVANNIYTVVNMVQSRGYGFKAEHEADVKGIEYAFKAGYNPFGSVVIMERFQEQFNDNELPDLANWVNPHPKYDLRITNFRKFINSKPGKATYAKDNDHSATLIVDSKPIIKFSQKQSRLQPWHRAELAAGAVNLFVVNGGTPDQLWCKSVGEDLGDVEIYGDKQLILRVTIADAEEKGLSPDQLAISWRNELEKVLKDIKVE